MSASVGVRECQTVVHQRERDIVHAVLVEVPQSAKILNEGEGVSMAVRKREEENV